MFRRYLLKNRFWPVKNRNGETVFVTHNASQGGVYAFLERQNERRGVRIVAGDEETFFDNFEKLDEYLDQIKRSTRSQSNFVSILERRSRQAYFRQLAL